MMGEFGGEAGAWSHEASGRAPPAARVVRKAPKGRAARLLTASGRAEGGGAAQHRWLPLVRHTVCSKSYKRRRPSIDRPVKACFAAHQRPRRIDSGGCHGLDRA